MEWIPPVLLVLGLLVVGVPVAVYFGAFALLWALSLFPDSPVRSRTYFFCPFKKRSVTADFLTEAGRDHPSDVVSCSGFAQPQRVTCKKACLELAGTRTVSTTLLPRFSLIAGGTAYRAAASPGVRAEQLAQR